MSDIKLPSKVWKDIESLPSFSSAPWTPFEDEILVQTYLIKKTSAIAKLLREYGFNRTVSAIKNRASILKERKTFKYMEGKV